MCRWVRNGLSSGMRLLLGGKEQHSHTRKANAASPACSTHCHCCSQLRHQTWKKEGPGGTGNKQAAARRASPGAAGGGGGKLAARSGRPSIALNWTPISHRSPQGPRPGQGSAGRPERVGRGGLGLRIAALWLANGPKQLKCAGMAGLAAAASARPAPKASGGTRQPVRWNRLQAVS